MNSQPKCAGCRNALPKKEYLQCLTCKGQYDLDCANVTYKLYCLMQHSYFDVPGANIDILPARPTYYYSFIWCQRSADDVDDWFIHCGLACGWVERLLKTRMRRRFPGGFSQNLLLAGEIIGKLVKTRSVHGGALLGAGSLLDQKFVEDQNTMEDPGIDDDTVQKCAISMLTYLGRILIYCQQDPHTIILSFGANVLLMMLMTGSFTVDGLAAGSKDC
ncbi:unnamed protein product [Leptidea sinapis]|uniref:Uncharacterized protein n=1 Tax=Leptidea sinapis TaxID=189913 RepID=A0A5E4QBG0_9NEOP|nr:unnamed protein product [Leptidea sinapis]